MRRNGKLGWFPWYPRDWKAENGLRRTSIVVRGIWREMLDAMFVDQTCSLSGDVAELAAIADCEINEMEQFLETAKHRKFCNVTECNGTFTVTSRRFAKEEEDRELAREQTRLRVQKHRQKKAHVTEVTKNHDVTPLHSSVSDSVSVSDSDSGSSKNRKQKSESSWPQGFELSQRMIEDAVRIAREGNFEVEPRSEFEAWHDDCLAHGRKYRDWEGAWRTRIRNKPNFSSRASPNSRRETPVEIAKRRLLETVNGQATGQKSDDDARRSLPLVERH